MKDTSRWQAYLDGLVTDAERESIESDPEAMGEVDAWRRYTQTIRDAGCSEVVPTAILKSSLRAVTRPQGVSLRKLAWAVPAIACIAFGANALVDRGSITVPFLGSAWVQGAERKAKVVSSAEEAAQWIQAETGLPGPVIKLWDETIPHRVRAGSNWGSFDLLVCDQLYTVTLTREAQAFPTENFAVLAADVTGYVTDRRVIWLKDDVTICVEGRTPELRLRIAKLVAALLGPSKPRDC